MSSAAAASIAATAVDVCSISVKVINLGQFGGGGSERGEVRD
jgi:hypothetical protein